MRQWEADGRPLVPAVAVDGRVTSVLHPAQVASLVGVAGPAELESVRLAWDLAEILESWLEEVESASWEVLLVPTPSRGRTLKHLTVNVFLPISLLPAAWRSHDFPWHPERDDPLVEATVPGHERLVTYARGVLRAWTDAVLTHEEDWSGDDPLITSPRGDLPFSQLLMSQRWHAGFHLAQLADFYAARGLPRASSFDPRNLADLDLPDDVFSLG